jgi:hypothetical protein
MYHMIHTNKHELVDAIRTAGIKVACSLQVSEHRFCFLCLDVATIGLFHVLEDMKNWRGNSSGVWRHQTIQVHIPDSSIDSRTIAPHPGT